MMTIKIIAFFGPDGSGKTTLVNMLRLYLERRGIKTKVFWIRGLHTLALLVALFLSKFKNMYGIDIPQLKLRITSRRVWCILESLSLIPLIAKYYVLKHLMSKNTVFIQERSFIDSTAWLLTHYLGVKPCSLMDKLLLSLSIREYDAIIYVKASLETILTRRRYEKIPPVFLRKQMRIYDYLYKVIDAKSAKCIIDTTNNSRTESFSELLSCIEKILMVDNK